jgi:hypothetical protein
MTIAIAAAAIWSTSVVGSWRSYLRAPAIAVVVVALLIPAAGSGRPFVRAQMQTGALDAVHEICRATGPDAAIAIEPVRLLGAVLPQTLRGFCGVHAAAIKDNVPIPKRIIDRFKAFDKQLYIVSAAPLEEIQAADERSHLIKHMVISAAREPERALGRKARNYSPRRIELWLYRVDMD